MREHIYTTYLDFGVIGEQEVEVFYDYFAGLGSNDQYLPPEPEYAEVTDVCVFLDGKQLSILSLLNSSLIEDLAYECLEDFNA